MTLWINDFAFSPWQMYRRSWTFSATPSPIIRSCDTFWVPAATPSRGYGN